VVQGVALVQCGAAVQCVAVGQRGAVAQRLVQRVAVVQYVAVRCGTPMAKGLVGVFGVVFGIDLVLQCIGLVLH